MTHRPATGGGLVVPLLAWTVVAIAWAALGLAWLARATCVVVLGGIAHYRQGTITRCTTSCRTPLDHRCTTVVR